MGWSESPPFFCAATETARDIIDDKMCNNVILPEQPLENIMMAVDWTTVDKLPNQPAATECDQRKFLSLIEVCIDDFIGVYPPQLVSTHSTRGTPPHPRQRTRRAPASLPRLRRCIQMGSWRSLVQRYETTNPNRMVLRMASNNQEPVLLGLEQNWVTHNIGPGTNRHTPPVAYPRTRG
jgi:hypothetical protein